MSAPLTADETRAALRLRDVPERLIDRHIERSFPGATLGRSAIILAPLAEIALPLRLTLPWSALCSDNVHEKASLTNRGGKVFPRKVLDARYKLARDKTRDVAKEVVAGAAPLNEPLAVHALVYLPGGTYRNDPINFSKCCHDALQGIVYTNDRWLYDARWTRAGIDVDAPRADLTISRYLEGGV